MTEPKPNPINMENFHVSLLDQSIADPATPEQFTAGIVDYLKDHPDEVGRGRFTEVHLIEGKPVIIVAPKDSEGTAFGGNHSLVDEIQQNDNYRFINFLAALDKPGMEVSTSTIVAGGLLKISPSTGQASLKLDNLRAKDLQWVEQLAEVARESGIDGPVSLSHSSPHAKETNLDTVGVEHKVYVEHEYLEGLGSLDGQNMGVSSGILTGLVLEPITVGRNNRSSEIKRQQAVSIRTIHSNCNRHAPLYVHAGIDDEQGMIDVEIDGQTVGMGMKYTNDVANDRRSINFIYDDYYGEKVAAIQQAIVGELASSFLDSPHPLKVTASVGHSLIQDYWL